MKTERILYKQFTGVFWGMALLGMAAVLVSSCEHPSGCAEEGQEFSSVYADYPTHCCEGLTAWHAGMDTRISVAKTCYETGRTAGNPVGICINCGNHFCDELENVCNCPADCSDGTNSDYGSVDEFCSDYWNDEMNAACSEGDMQGLPICELCWSSDFM